MTAHPPAHASGLPRPRHLSTAEVADLANVQALALEVVLQGLWPGDPLEACTTLQRTINRLRRELRAPNFSAPGGRPKQEPSACDPGDGTLGGRRAAST